MSAVGDPIAVIAGSASPPRVHRAVFRLQYRALCRRVSAGVFPPVSNVALGMFVFSEILFRASSSKESD